MEEDETTTGTRHTQAQEKKFWTKCLRRHVVYVIFLDHRFLSPIRLKAEGGGHVVLRENRRVVIGDSGILPGSQIGTPSQDQ